ncbi:E3 ubiquitin-protein ligase Arkadia-like [Asparagus officinalis]|nr:E3 ubiquitin-protein ligase Arkadia-like [Asparagus officinalis]
MNEFGINSRYVGSIREFGKIKNEEIPLRSFNSSSSFLPLHRGLPQWESSYLQGTLSDYRNFEYPEYQERGYIRTEEEYHRYLRMTLDWQLWLSWNYNRAITDLHDFNPTSQHNLHQPLSLAQTMQLPYYGRQLQIQAPYFQHSLDTSNLFGLNPVSLSSSSTFPHLLLNAEHIIRDYWEQNAAPNFSHAGGRILPLEDAELMNVRELHSVENTIDPFEDMRLDTDGMAYEDLLALGEEIGNVNTGLEEESITKNLKTSLYNSQTEYLPPNQCMICQEELKENEIIGILDCGHNYHEKCIKEWLLNKNLCPICKETALARDNSEG